MKKTTHLISLMLLVFIISCVDTDDYDIPKIEIEEPELSANSNISAVKNAYDQSGEDIYTFDETDTSLIEGYVISSDEAGNFYKSLIIQDNLEDPTSGIEILIDQKAYFTKFNFGRKIFIKMAGLSMSNEEGKYKIGYNLINKVEEIPESLVDHFIIRSAQTATIIPKKISLANLSNELLNTFVQLKNIQFRKDELGKTFAGEKFDEFNGERVLTQCNNLLQAVLSTSTYSDFRSNLIPDKKGILNAVFTKDYYGEKYVLVLNDLSTFNFTDMERCDPEFLHCASDINEGSHLLFYENFEEINKTKDLEELGWTNANMYLGNEKFKKRSSQGNVSMQISAYNTGENPLEAWLITPPINLDESRNEILSFETKASYDNGTILTAWVSSDLKENIREATWQQLDVKISVGSGNSYINSYISSGKISLDCLEGDVFIALKYSGGDPGISTTYDLDNFKITSD